MMRHGLFASLAAALSATNAVGQTTHLVGPGGFPQIQDAVLAASPGDVILVQPGTYGIFNCNKGLTIRGTVPGAALAAGFPFNILSVPVGQSARIVDMRLAGLYAGHGQVAVENCLIDGPNGVLWLTSTVAMVQDCVIQPAMPTTQGGQPALLVMNSEVTIIDCIVRGYDGMGAFVAPGPGIGLMSSRLSGSNLDVAGGVGLPVVPAVRADWPSRVWLSDSTVAGDPATCAIQAPNGRYDRCTLSPNCTTLPTGFVLGLHRPQPLQNGATFQLDFRALPGMPVGVWIDDHVAASTLPEFEQSVLLSPATAFPVGVLVADGTGLGVGNWSVPASPALVDRTAWFQGFAGMSLPLQASPLAGGVIR